MPLCSQVNSQMIKAWSIFQSLTNKDLRTAQHSIDVACIAYAVVSEFIQVCMKSESVFIAGLLHDIGKERMPDIMFTDYIVQDDDKGMKKIIYRHPLDTKEILQSEGFEPDIITTAFMHHERCDGSGYPLGIEGTSIPPAARVLAIVDSFSAMTKDRYYRKRFETSEAISELLRCSEKYDQEFLQIFAKNIEDIEKRAQLVKSEYENSLHRRE